MFVGDHETVLEAGGLLGCELVGEGCVVGVLVFVVHAHPHFYTNLVEYTLLIIDLIMGYAYYWLFKNKYFLI